MRGSCNGDAGIPRLTVIKLGGSVLTSARAYGRAAVFVRKRRQERPDEKLVVVVSAQEGITDELERAARKIVREPDTAALDLLWSTGELRSVALLALHLQKLNVFAAGLNVHQSGLAATEDDCHAESVRVNSRPLLGAVDRCGVAIVPGFLAVNPSGGVVSLGRGGSDLTAVLLAEGLGACRCELVKDVPGYFTADPHRDVTARHLPSLTFDEALALADAGCDLVQRTAIVAAARCKLPLVVRTFDEKQPFSYVASARTESAWERAAATAEAAC
jgi:aspartate kinase